MILERKEKIEYEPLKTESYADYQIEQRHRNAGIGIRSIPSISRRV